MIMENQLINEAKTSAITLSDMELFVFPELIYSLVLANIMSPCIWQWRNDPWFKNIESKKPYKRIQRLKQFIMDNFAFNLDLETWGLTRQEIELERFKPFIDPRDISASNALFGYQGDQYYFDVDIRRHFGLDKYEGSIIPYWKTETVEAMQAFRYRKGYTSGAGECVSLATLYAAALFIVCRIPLSDIYLMATPLHSQNYVDVGDGILTNNRRIVTKKMWANGTELSAKARRAIENERVTIVAHESGIAHLLYPEASIHPDAYRNFYEKISHFVATELTSEILGNFLRHRRDVQKCFQVRWFINNAEYYIESEKIFSYEVHSPYLFTSQNRSLLMNEIDVDDFHSSPIPQRIVFNELEEYVERTPIDFRSEEAGLALREKFQTDCLNASTAIEALFAFCNVIPRLPEATEKTFFSFKKPLAITTEMERNEIIAHLHSIRHDNIMAEYAFYAYRDISTTDILPFLQAAWNRNPVSTKALEKSSLDTLIDDIRHFADESIYPEPTRLAQPDEVWNFRRGDGVEKALLMANLFHHKKPEDETKITIEKDNVRIEHDKFILTLKTQKNLKNQIWSTKDLYSYH